MTKIKPTASILKNAYCKACNWPIIDVVCNDEMSSGVYGKWDWWQYCSNKGCKNHVGEGVFQNDPEFVSYLKEEDNDKEIL